MKKLLYGTTALVTGAALVSSPAFAEEGIKLGLGGYMNQYFGALLDNDGEDDTDYNWSGIFSDGEIWFKPCPSGMASSCGIAILPPGPRAWKRAHPTAPGSCDPISPKNECTSRLPSLTTVISGPKSTKPGRGSYFRCISRMK